jgi:hypothetical protein
VGDSTRTADANIYPPGETVTPGRSAVVGPENAHSNEAPAKVRQPQGELEHGEQQGRGQQNRQSGVQLERLEQQQEHPTSDTQSNMADPRSDSTELSNETTAVVGAIGAAIAGGTDSLNAFSATLDVEADKLVAAQRRTLRDADGGIDAQMLDETKDLLVSSLTLTQTLQFSVVDAIEPVVDNLVCRCC